MKLKSLVPAVIITAALLFAGIFLLRNSSSTLPPSEVIQTTLENQERWNEHLPEDRVYALLDKPFYAPGESIWFTAFVRNGADLKAANQSRIVRAELINPKGEEEMAYKVPVSEEGIAKGDFKLAKDLPGGKYQIKVYTQWQNNEKTPAIFTKEIMVQKVVLPNLKMNLDFEREAFAPGDKVEAELSLKNMQDLSLANKSFRYQVSIQGKEVLNSFGKTDSNGKAIVKFDLKENLEVNDAVLNITLDHNGTRESIARNVPVLLSDIDVAFFPEGGDMINGLESRIGFKAVDKSGNPVDIEGVIVNKKGEEVADFNTLRMGMGAFSLTPSNGDVYKARVTFPSHIPGTFKLPSAKGSGFTLAVKKVTEEKIDLTIGSTSKAYISLVASVRGENQYSSGVKLKEGQNDISIPVEEFPIGVAQITLFDSHGIARAERLAFVNDHKQLDIRVSTNKEQYLPREKVEVTVDVTDEDGKPVQTDFAVSVVDDQLLSFADDKSSNILSWMLVEADLDVDAEEASYYFDPNERDAKLGLDHLLMTSGWRKFSWEMLASNELPKIETRAEKMVVAGTVLDDDGNPISRAKVQVQGVSKPVSTQEDGYFEIANIDLTDEPVTVSVSAKGHFRQEQIVGDYGMFEYQLFNRDQATPGMVINERANRTIQASQLGLAENITTRKPKKRVVSSIFTQSDFQVVNRGQRWNDKNEKAAMDYEPTRFEAGTEVSITDHRIRQIQDDEQLSDEEKEALRGAYLSEVAFYRVREFPLKKYKSTKINRRNDFRSTIFWDGHVKTDANGKAVLNFWNNDAVTTFQITVEGMSVDGHVGRTTTNYQTQMPFSLAAKIPVEVVVDDVLEIPVTMSNNTKYSVSGKLNINHPQMFEVVNIPTGNISLGANESKTVFLKYKVKKGSIAGDLDQLVIGFDSGQFSDKLQEDITVVPKGFPTRVAYSGTGMETKYEVKLRDLEKNTLEVELQAFPDALSEIIAGMEGMMSQPYGCFEQTSSANYPNVLALQYMRETGQSNRQVEAKARKLLKFGYERLKGFESPNGGFEWFGGPVGHEAITAFAVMQFTHMKEVYKPVDQDIIDRSAQWLLQKRDGKGGFVRNERTTWSLGLQGNKADDLFNTFIVYCLSEAKIKGLDIELKKSFEAASESDDPYMIGMAALAQWNYGNKSKSAELTKRADQLIATGSAIVSSDNTTVFGSRGKSFELEAKSLLVLNLLNNAPDKNRDRINDLAESIRSSRDFNRAYGPTHTTVLALRAVTAHASFARQTQEAGTVEFHVSGKKVASKDFEAGEYEPIVIDGLERFFPKEGDYDFEVKFVGVENPLPHTVTFKWNAIRPNTSSDAPIAVNTEIKDDKIRMGDIVRMDVKVKNNTNKRQPTPMAIVGLPAGLSPQARQLDKLVEEGKVDYYEIVGNNIVFYFRHVKADKIFGIDLKAEFPGQFTAPASSAYCYYMPDSKDWAAGEQVTITK